MMTVDNFLQEGVHKTIVCLQEMSREEFIELGGDKVILPLLRMEEKLKEKKEGYLCPTKTGGIE
jgi:hypothetical protein